MDKFEKVRKEQFPITGKYAYLDGGTSGLFSKRTRDAMVGYLDDRYEDAMDMESYSAVWDFADGLRGTIAKVIGADASEICFGGCGSEMINIFSGGIELEEGANVVTSGLSFPSTPQTWMNRVGAGNVRVAEPENGMMPCEKLFGLVDGKTAVISLCMVENTSGWRHDIECISSFCAERGIYLVLDMTQCIGAMKIDVSRTPVDFIMTSTYKWLGGPFGTAFSYISKRVLDKVRPCHFGWTGNRDRLDQSSYRIDPAPGASRFETGGLNWAGLRGIEQSALQYLELGADDVQEYILGLTDYLYGRVAEQQAVGIVGPFPEENRSCIVYLKIPAEWELTDRKLRENGIRAHMSTPEKMRVGLHYYNNREDIDRLMDLFAAY